MTTDRGQPAVALRQAGAMPLVGLGTWQMTGARCQAAVRVALEVGYRHLDTATMYRTEREVGRAMRDSGVPREQVFLTTKLPPGAAGRERRTLDDSLRALGMDHVDLWLVHWPPRGRALVSTWKELLAARDQGLARAVGVSNYRPAQLDELIAATGAAPQVTRSRGRPRCTTPPCWASIADAGWCWRATARSRTPICATPCWARSPPVTG